MHSSPSCVSCTKQLLLQQQRRLLRRFSSSLSSSIHIPHPLEHQRLTDVPIRLK